MENNISLDNFANGAFAERVNQAIKKVMENIADPNTPWKPKRKITIEMVFEAKEDRDIAQIDIVAKPKLAPMESIHTKVIIDRTLAGEIIGAEFKKQIPGQAAIKVDMETGEIITDSSEKPGLKVLR